MLDDKLLSGYVYRNTPIPKDQRNPNQRYIIINTGVGGAKQLIEACREKGLPDEIIATQIQVYTDTHGWVALADITIKKIENGKI